RVDLATTIPACEDPPSLKTLSFRQIEPSANLAQQLTDLAPPSFFADLRDSFAALTLVEHFLQPVHGGVNEAGGVSFALHVEREPANLRGGDRSGDALIEVVGRTGSGEELVDLLGPIPEFAATGEGKRTVLL